MTIESIAIIGAGSIGGTVAFGLLSNEDRCSFKEILLVDMSKDITQAQVIDLSDAACGDVIVRGATFNEAGKCDLIILAANTAPVEKEPQSKWLVRNQRFIHGVTTSMAPIQPNAFMIVAVEPVDIFVDQLRKTTTLKSDRIMGVGHITICHRRFHRWFEEYQSGLQGSPYASDPWVIGTAKSPLVIWPKIKDSTMIDKKGKGSKLKKEIQPDEDEDLIITRMKELDELKNSWVGNAMFQSHLIREKKGDAWFGASTSVIQLAKTLLNPDSTHSLHMVVSSFNPHFNLCTSLPVIITNQGISSTIELSMTNSEKDTLISSSLDYFETL
ncbi:unnamed protein product [Absidia cylindrospora]